MKGKLRGKRYKWSIAWKKISNYNWKISARTDKISARIDKKKPKKYLSKMQGWISTPFNFNCIIFETIYGFGVGRKKNAKEELLFNYCN